MREQGQAVERDSDDDGKALGQTQGSLRRDYGVVRPETLDLYARILEDDDDCFDLSLF